MNPRIKVLIVGGAFAVVTFLLFYFGVAYALNQEIIINNLLAFGLFSILVGIIAGIFAYINRNIGLIIFSIAYVIGFASMIYTFKSDMTGWEGVIGLLQMMLILGIGIVCAVIVEIIWYFINKSRLKKHHL